MDWLDEDAPAPKAASFLEAVSVPDLPGDKLRDPHVMEGLESLLSTAEQH